MDTVDIVAFSNHTDSSNNDKIKCDDLKSALEYLLHVVEKHRLIFLYVAEANRKNPLARSSRTGIYETVIKHDIPGWKQLEEDIDNEGNFLFTHRSALEVYAQEAISEFGPGPGCNPSLRNTNGEWIEVDGGTLPYWSIDEITCQFLERSSDEILKACEILSSKDPLRTHSPLLKDVINISHAENHPRWYASLIIKWEYLSDLDKTIARIKEKIINGAANTDNIDSHNINRTNLEAAIISSVALRDLYRMRRLYPDVIEKEEGNTLHQKLVNQLESSMSNHTFDTIKEFYTKPEYTNKKAVIQVESFYCLLLAQHPDVRIVGESENNIKHGINKVLDQCQKEAKGELKEVINRLLEIQLLDCRMPAPHDDNTYYEPKRNLQMLERYWGLVRKTVLYNKDAMIGYIPNPLTQLLVNLRARINICIDRLNKEEDFDEVKHIIDEFIDILNSGEPDTLSAASEWTDEQIQSVENVIARTRIKMGSKTYTLTHAEEMFIDHAYNAINELHKETNREWGRIIRRVEKDAKMNQDNINTQQAVNRSATERFPTPQGSTWSDVNIKFKDGHTVSIKVKDKVGIYHYTQMGMVNRKNGDPTVQWELLRAFADEYGSITWNSSRANRKNQKRRELLAKQLSSFFGITEDPFRLIDDRKGWKTRFVIVPDK